MELIITFNQHLNSTTKNELFLGYDFYNIDKNIDVNDMCYTLSKNVKCSIKGLVIDSNIDDINKLSELITCLQNIDYIDKTTKVIIIDFEKNDESLYEKINFNHLLDLIDSDINLIVKNFMLTYRHQSDIKLLPQSVLKSKKWRVGGSDYNSDVMINIKAENKLVDFKELKNVISNITRNNDLYNFLMDRSVEIVDETIYNEDENGICLSYCDYQYYKITRDCIINAMKEIGIYRQVSVKGKINYFLK